MDTNTVILPVLPVRGLILFPNITLNFDVGREISIKALQEAAEKKTEIFIVAQTDITNDEVNENELCSVGTVAKIKQIMN